MKRKQQTAKPPKYMAGVEVNRAGVSVHVAEIPSAQLAAVIRHALEQLEAAGVVDNSDDRPIEQIGGYAPLEVREDEHAEQGKRPKRVGF